MFYYNGQLKTNNYIELDINDSTWLYGASIFSTLRVYNQSLNHPLTNWQKHCDRLKKTINELELQSPDWQRIEIEVKELLKYFPVLRITLFPDGKELIIGRELPINLKEKQQQGIKGLVCLDPLLKRSLAAYKTGNYLAPWLSLQKAKKIGYQEAILTNSEQDWLETSTGNLWGYQQGTWFTPDLNVGILPGIARGMILEQATFAVETNRWTPEFISNLEAIAYSNSVVEIIPFQTIKIGEQIREYPANHEAYASLTEIYNNLRNN